MSEAAERATQESKHAEKLVRLNPHGHWRRVPEASACSCGDILKSCLLCTQQGNISSSYDSLVTTTNSANVVAEVKARAEQGFEKAKTTNSQLQSRHTQFQGQQLECQQQHQERLIQSLHNSSDAASMDAASQASEHPHFTWNLTAEEARASGFKILWYDPDVTYNPLYYGETPDETHRQEIFEERRDWTKYVDPGMALKYTGFLLGATAGVGALGLGFLVLFAGLAAGLVAKELVPYCKSANLCTIDN